MTAATAPAMHDVAALAAALDRREQQARALAAHMADTPPVDPDPDYTPRHRRNDAR